MYANPQNGTRNLSPRSGFSPAPAGGRGLEPPTANSTFSIADLVRRRWKYMLVSGVICIALAVWLGGLFSTKTWTYSTVLLYQPPISGTGSAGLDLPTLRTMVKARSTLEQLIADFNLDLHVIVLDKLIEAEIPPASSSLVLTLKGESPEQAEGMLNRLVEILCANTAAIWRESMDRKCNYSSAELDRAKQSVDRAQRELAEFAQQTKIVDIAHDLTGLKTVITTLEEKVRDQHQEQLELLTQKAKPAVLTTSLSTKRAGIEQTAQIIAARRKELNDLLAARPQYELLADAVAAAQAARERAELDLSAAEQARDVSSTQLAVVQKAKPVFIPVSSDRKKVTLGVFAMAAMLLGAPLLLIEWTDAKSKEAPLARLSRKLDLPLLAPPPTPQQRHGTKSTCASIDEQYARLLALRIQQGIAGSRSVVLFSSLVESPIPQAMLFKLAECLSHRGQRVLLIDAMAGIGSPPVEHLELTEQSASVSAGVGGARFGVSDYLTLEQPEIDRLVTRLSGFDYIVSGSAPLPREGFAMQSMTDLLEQLRDRYTLVLVAGPSISETVDLELLAARSDGIVFFSPNGQAMAAAAETIGHLHELQAPILGVMG